ncbi:TetR/AcrR family transcriptional regulator [Plantibacter sp. Mn2098]|uniref:TetR/AcrR family transcriptional regulator n=1 Tax=Plantibacter sp. Mn2098 TaxID=3395266 RepID=UPI003BCB87AF
MTEQPSPRDRIVEAASELLSAGGRDAVSTRAVSAAAGVQPPTIYRLFGDMSGLLDAVTSHGFAAYLHTKRNRTLLPDPVDDLRAGWDLHVAFGVANPALYSLMYGQPEAGAEPTAAREAEAVLRSLIERVAVAGRLLVDVDRAVQMVHAASSGVALTLIATLPERRDPLLSETMREAVLTAITTPADAAGTSTGSADGSSVIARHAVSLAAAIADDRRNSALPADEADAAETTSPGETGVLTDAETALLTEWLGKLANAAG